MDLRKNFATLFLTTGVGFALLAGCDQDTVGTVSDDDDAGFGAPADIEPANEPGAFDGPEPNVPQPNLPQPDIGEPGPASTQSPGGQPGIDVEPGAGATEPGAAAPASPGAGSDTGIDVEEQR